MKSYICECGKQFDNPQKFNGHKSHCSIHLRASNKYEAYIDRECIRKQTCRNTWEMKKSERRKKQNELSKIKDMKWVEENHACKKCGKLMLEKWGNGVFCSPACAHSHKHSAESKQKIRESLIETYQKSDRKKRNDSRKLNYASNPNHCEICGKVLPYNKRKNKVCCKKCQNILEGSLARERCAKQGTNLCGKGLRGYYKGYYCQSSWELAYVIFCLDHNIKIIRNKERFSYIFGGVERSYFPDFYLIDSNQFVEVKGYYDDKTKAKEEQFPKDKKLVMLKKDQMLPILKYVFDKYGDDFTKLYDKG